MNGQGGGTYVKSVPFGTVLTVVATPDSGYVFNGWEGTFAGQTNSFTYQVTSNISTNALFAASTTKPVAVDNCGNLAPYLRIFSNVTGGGFLIIGATSYSLYSDNPQIVGAGVGYTYNCTEWQIPEPVPNYGYVFKGWTGNLASTTLNSLNLTGYINTSQFNQVATPTLTAMFEFNGTPNANSVGQELSRPVSS